MRPIIERDPEDQAHFQRALQKIAAEEQLEADELFALNVLPSTDVEAARQAWAGLPAGARARLVRELRDAAIKRLALDFSWLNHLALEDEAEEVRLSALESNLEDVSPRLFETLLRLLREDPSHQVRRAAAEDLARYALLAEVEGVSAAVKQQVKDALLGALNDPLQSPGTRSAAMAALGYFSDEDVQDVLGNAFSEPDLRLGAIRGMGRSADPRWVTRLLPVLGSDDAEMREQAALALGELEDERAVGPLAEMVDDPDWPVRAAVINALGQIGGEDAREALLYLVQGPDDQAREAAEKAINALEEEEEDPLDL